MNALRYLKAAGSALLISVALLNLNACSISNSSGSVSDSAGSVAKSSGNISDSSTSSSKGGTSEKKADDDRYAIDAQDYTATYMRANTVSFDKNTFMKGLSDVASQHGVVDWEANPKTFRAIGKGLRKARVSGAMYDNFKKEISGSDSGKMDDIQEGYDN
ncbi:hypothetical protein MCAMS1_01473 [biofilm metagenome]